MLLKLSKRARNNAAYQQYKAHTSELSSNRDSIPTTTVRSETDTLGAHELKKMKSNHYSQFRYQPNKGTVTGFF